jgi:type I restriction enzyme R subunit
MLESVRNRLRGLVQFIERRKRKIIYTDFADEMGEQFEIDIDGLKSASSFEQFRRKARHFLQEHKDTLAIEKVHRNRPITPADLAELERVLVESGVGTTSDVARARTEAGSFGLFVRSLVGLDRAAAKAAFGGFLDGETYSANQIEFVNLIIDDLTEHGVVGTSRFYESPFTDISPQGPEALFTEAEVDHLLQVLADVRHNAEVA